MKMEKSSKNHKEKNLNLKLARKKSKGFTILEIMISLSILILIITLSVPKVNGFSAKTQKVQEMEVMEEVLVFLHMMQRYAGENKVSFDVSVNYDNGEFYVKETAYERLITFKLPVDYKIIAVAFGDGALATLAFNANGAIRRNGTISVRVPSGAICQIICSETKYRIRLEMS